MRIGLVGLGRMGAAMATRLKERGHDVIGWDKDARARARHVERGFVVADSPRGVVAPGGIVISTITEDKGARRVFTGPDGFLSANVEGALFIEMSTLRPATHRELAPLTRAKGAALVDAPVMGSIPTVREGKLLALVGGEAADVERARGVLDDLARRIVHLGPKGAGCAMKLSINLAMAIYIQSLAEAMSLAESEGLTRDAVLDILGESPTVSPFLKGKLAVLRGEPTDVTLDIRTLCKDVMSAVATGATNGVGLPAAASVLNCLSAAVAAGWGEKDLAEAPAWFRENAPRRYED